MKKIVNVATPAVCVVALVLSVAAITNTNAATAPTPVVASAPAGQPVDLTYAAEKALPSVVYIKSVQNSKIQTVEYNDPFEDSSQIPLVDSLDADKEITVSASVRFRPPSVQLQAQASSSLPMVILLLTIMLWMVLTN